MTRWNTDGTWARPLARAQADADEAGELDWLVAVDSTAVRVHQHGATARRTGGNAPTVPADREVAQPPRRRAGAPPNDKNCPGEPAQREPEDHAIGRSRGGLTTKVHALTDGHGRVLAFRLTGGNVHDSGVYPAAGRRPGPRVGAGRPRTRPDYLVADKAYSSRLHRSLLRRHGIGYTIAEPDDQKSNRRRKGSAGGRPAGFDPARYARRNTIERVFCQLKQWRAWPPAMTSTRTTTPPQSPSRPC